MVFVAAMALPEGLEPYVAINNDSGYQYHFASDACHTLRVIADVEEWSRESHPGEREALQLTPFPDKVALAAELQTPLAAA